MKRLLAALSLLAITVSGTAAGYDQLQDYSFYIKVGSGISCSEAAHVVAPSPPWTETIQGYNSRLGNCPIGGLSIGYEFCHMVDLEVSISNRSTFEYRKVQIASGGTDSFTRKFDLSITPVLFSINLLGQNMACLNWDIGCGKIYPTLGAGVGASDILITNFRTTGLPPNGDSSPYPSFSTENEYTLRRNFTYTLLAGVEYNYNDSWVIGTGYRWFDAGHFKGPQYLRLSTGSSIDVGSDQWKMRFRANEWYIEFKIFI